MGDHSNIEWTEATWNPVRGCSIVSPGCTNCYAMRQAHRFSAPGQPYAGLTKLSNGGPVWTGKVTLHPELLDWPLRKKKPLRIFVNSMSDLFHEGVSDEFILRVFDVMRQCENGYSSTMKRTVAQHTFQILTKRPERMLDFCSRLRFAQNDGCGLYLAKELPHNGFNPMKALKHVWMGVSVEDQKRADERIPLLLQMPAAVRWISAEPLLGPIDLRFLQPGDPPTEIDALEGAHGVIRPHRGRCARLDWVVAGGESGPGARPFDIAWARSLRDQCQAAGVPYFLKQVGAHPIGCFGGPGSVVCPRCHARTDLMGGHLTDDECKNRWRHPWKLKHRKGGDPQEWPTDLRVREYPT